MRYFLVFYFIFVSISIFGATCTTTSTTSWDCGTPGSNDDLIVNHNITITGDFTVNNGSITVNSPNTLTITGDLTFNNNSTVLVNNGGCIHVMGDFENKNNSGDVDILGTLIVDGNFTNGTGSGMGAIINVGSSGTITIGGTCSNPGTVENDTDSFTGCENVILPVELVNFRGTATPQGNLLQWETASERNNHFFEVQRSLTGNDWEGIGEVLGNGNSDVYLSYQYLDRNPLSGRNFYRLKQVDFDGVFEYSYIISVVTGEIPQLQVQSYYPNPTDRFITISYLANNELPVAYEVYDQFGKLIYSHQNSSNFGFNEVTLDFQTLVNGTYLIKLRNQALTKNIRFIKVN